jgi:hypothetical protein
MDDFDFDSAASAFPDISLGFNEPVETPAPPAAFSFDNFGSPPRQSFTDVKVTGDDEIEKFEDQFPDIDVGYVRLSLSRAHAFAPIHSHRSMRCEGCRRYGFADAQDIFRLHHLPHFLRNRRLEPPLRSHRVLNLPHCRRRPFSTSRFRKKNPRWSGK